jgi:hypothetical protein
MFDKKAYQKKYQRAYHKKRYAKDAEREGFRVRSAIQKAKSLAYQRDLKERTPCADCGRHFHFAAMDFDHIDGTKVAGIATLAIAGSFQKMLREIEKCEVVCSNCHRIRTFVRRT